MKQITRRIGNIIEFIVGFFDCHPAKTIITKTLLIVRLDAIGDYILFRNFIEEIRKSDGC